MSLDITALEEVAKQFDWAIDMCERDTGYCDPSVYAAQDLLRSIISDEKECQCRST